MRRGKEGGPEGRRVTQRMTHVASEVMPLLSSITRVYMEKVERSDALEIFLYIIKLVTRER